MAKEYNTIKDITDHINEQETTIADLKKKIEMLTTPIIPPIIPPITPDTELDKIADLLGL